MIKTGGCLLRGVFGVLGAIAGAIVGILLRPSFPNRGGGEALDKPSLLMMIQNGLSGTHPTERTALIYLFLGVIVGGLVGLLLASLISRKRAHES